MRTAWRGAEVALIEVSGDDLYLPMQYRSHGVTETDSEGHFTFRVEVDAKQ